MLVMKSSSNDTPPKVVYPSGPEKSHTEHKRRRVTRACDNCRQKKVKCDGKQPCIHCTVYSYNCTYDQPNIRNKKNSGIPVPAGNLSIANVNALNAQQTTPGLHNNLVLSQNIINLMLPKLKLNLFEESNLFNFDRFQKTIRYLQHRNPLHVTLSDISDLYLDNSTPITSPSVVDKIDHPSTSSNDDNALGREIKIILPSKAEAIRLIHTTWYKACVLFRFYHRPSLLEELDLLYILDPLNYTDRQQKFLPFLYSVLACGLLFSRLSGGNTSNNDTLEDDGFRYFQEARKLIDITNVGDMISIQTIVMMIMYLQCSARLSTCYSYIGIAMRSAIKEGLHRNLSIFQNSKRKLDPIEIDSRKRLFFTIYKMDIYINSLLGLPRSIDEDEIDQELPEELDDENITHDAFLYEKQEGRLSSAACANHHTRLMLIMSHLVRDLYPIKVKNRTDDADLTPDYIHTKVSQLELELKTWLDCLPMELKPIDPNDTQTIDKIPEKFVLANCYLHLSFLNCQIMLYRPFIHFVSNGSIQQASDPRSLIRGRNCIKVARMVVKLANKMIDKNLLIGTYWFSMYTIFFSIACLIYYYHFANYNFYQLSGVNYAGVLFDDDLNIDMIKKDIEVGKKVLDCLKNSSNSSLRIYNILNNLFEQLNRRTANRGKVESTGLNAPPVMDKSHELLQDAFVNFNSINSFTSMNDLNFQLSNPSAQPNLVRPVKQGPLDSSAIPTSKVPEIKPTTYDPIPYDSGFKDYKGNLPLPYSESSSLNSSKIPDGHANVGMNSNIPEAHIDVINAPSPAKPDLKNSANAKLKNDNAEPSPKIVSSDDISPEKTDLTVNDTYIPGVIDKLDAQIFGRILPPYMLEKSAKQTENAEAYQLENQRNKSEIDPFNVEDLNFSTVDESSNLDFLDPFTDTSAFLYNGAGNRPN